MLGATSNYFKLILMAVGQRVFFVITLISFFLVGHILYDSFTYGKGAWNLNKGKDSSSQSILLLIIPVFFLTINYIYKRAYRKGLTISKGFLAGHIITSIFCLLLLASLTFPFQMQNNSVPFSMYSTNQLTSYKLVSYLLGLIQLIFVILLIRLLFQKSK